MSALLEFTRGLQCGLVRGGEGGRRRCVAHPLSAQWAGLPEVREEGRLVKMEIDIARVEEHLLLWAALRMGGGGIGGGGARGYLGRTPGLTGSRGLDNADWHEEVYTEMDKHIANCVDGVMTGLPMHEQAAIWEFCGLSVAAKFPRLDMAQVLVDAKQHVGEGLVRKGVAV
jgi:hypothetical protein